MDRSSARQRLFPAARHIQPPQLDPGAIVPAEDDASAVARDVRLIVIGALGMGQLDRRAGSYRLAPQRSAHAVDEASAVRSEAGAGRPGRQLRKIELTPIIAV